MSASRVSAATGALLVHGLALAALLTMAGPTVVQPPIRPVEVVLLPSMPPAARSEPPPRPPPPPKDAGRPQAVQAAATLPPPSMPPAAARPPAPAPTSAPSPTPAMPPQASSAAPIDSAAPAPARPAETARPTAIASEAPSAAASSAPRADSPSVPRVEPQREGPRVDASWAGNMPPPYPALAKRLGDEGEVRLDVHVGTDGTVLDVRIRRSSGSPVLDQTAMDTVRKWRFKPATVDGKPVAEWYQNWRWVFKLES